MRLHIPEAVHATSCRSFFIYRFFATLADAELAKSLFPEENFDYPRPATVSPKDTDAFRDSLDELGEKDNIIKLPERKPEGPEKKAA